MKSSTSGHTGGAGALQGEARGGVIDVDDDSFDAEVLRAERPVLVDFGAVWCGPCRALEPIIARIAEEHAREVKVVRVDIDECPRVAQRYQVRGAPTILIFKNGERTRSHLGVTTKERLMALLAD